jgi:hypothetical protein
MWIEPQLVLHSYRQTVIAASEIYRLRGDHDWQPLSRDSHEHTHKA